MERKKTKKQIEQEGFEAMSQRALRPFKPSLNDEEIGKFEEKVRQKSIENLRKQREGLNAHDRQKINGRIDFEYHI